MSSFTKEDYQTVYASARRIHKIVRLSNLKSSISREDIQKETAVIMQLCVNVIGQQSDYPEELR